MKVIVSGASGRMGHIICSMSEDEVIAKVGLGAKEMFPENGYETLADYTGEADIVIDFSNHVITDSMLAYCKARKLPVVVATTGQTPEEREAIIAASKEIPVFFAANMSVGVAVLADLARRAAAMFPNADIEIIEIHHNRKLDVPSGTALALANAIKDVRPDAEFVIGRHENGKRRPQEIGIHSLRYGNETGTHEIIISTDSETITLKHESQTRALFADGAWVAARFLCGKEPGLYDMKNILG